MTLKSGSRSWLGSSNVRLAIPSFCVREDDRKIGLLVIRAEFDEQIEYFVDDFGSASIFAIDFIDDDDRLEIEFQRFAQHKARLRHHALGGIDQQQHALPHLQYAFDLTAEIGMSRCIDDVELYIAMANRRIFRKDRNPALAFERV